MSGNRTWLLPEGIYEFLPSEAERIEAKRHTVLDLFARWGYRLILPPLVDHTENLFSQRHDDLAERTFQFGDPLTGRMLGVRADITPQAARMDALLRHKSAMAPSLDAKSRSTSSSVSRLCYCGEVVYTSADNLLGRRSLIQCGAEIFGCNSLEADIEIMELMVQSIQLCGINEVVVDIGHQGVLSGLLDIANLSDAQAALLLELIERKAITEYRDYLEGLSLPLDVAGWLLGLPECYGGIPELVEAESRFEGAPDVIKKAIQEVRSCVESLVRNCPEVSPYFDLAELRGFHYHTGLVFAAYTDRYGQAVAKGGRYDGAALDSKSVSTVSRPATGFSMDLTLLLQVSGEEVRSARDWVWAKPSSTGGSNDKQFAKAVQNLRASGHCVVVALPNQESPPPGCAHRLVQANGDQWSLQPLVTNEQDV